MEPRLALSTSPILLDLNPDGSSNPSSFVEVGSLTFFVANDGSHGRELWVTDGTGPGTHMVADINPDSESSSPTGLVNVDGVLYFSATDGENGVELWRSDGTEEGTYMVRDVFTGTYSVGYQTVPNSSSPDQLTAVGDTLYFTARDGVNGVELWKSDGTEEGTVLVRNIYEGTADDDATPNSSSPTRLVDFNGTLYFTAYDDEHGRELWKSDGTEAGTVLVKDIWTGTSEYDDGETVEDIPNSSRPGLLTVVDGTLFFVAQDEEHGAELWSTDGTEAGTALVKDIYEGETSAFDSLSAMIEMDGALYFVASDEDHGSELWRSDGTEDGTALVKDIMEGSEGTLSYYTGLTVVDGTLYFAADDGETGKELWKSDGTEDGTVLVKDIWVGKYDDDTPYSSIPYFITNVGGTLYFSAFTEETGRELWQSDGTAEGTTLVADLVDGTDEGNPQSLTAVNGQLFFVAEVDGDSDLWMYFTGEQSTVSIYVEGEAVEIPANVGVREDRSVAGIYTTDTDGVLSYQPNEGVTLGDFFNIWQTDAGLAGDDPDAILSSTQVLDYVTDTEHTLQVFVDGMIVTDFVDYELQGGEDIVIVYGSNPVISIVTDYGSILVELFEDETPGTVENFLNYVNDGDYVDSIFHRSVEDFVIQGGGYTTTSTTFTDTSQFTDVPEDDPITNEPGISNLRGTIAMAKLGGDPDSATSQFFFNLSDDNAVLDDEAYGAFTVFGQVLSMTTVDTIADLPIDTSNDSPFDELPLSEDDELAVVLSIEGQGEVSGGWFADLDGDGIQDNDEIGIAAAVVYIDANENGVFDDGETSTTTDADGNYLIQLDPGDYVVRGVAPVGSLQSLPESDGGYSVTVEIGREIADLDFGAEIILAPESVDLASSSDTGTADDDDLTALNNAGDATTIGFLVTGVTAGLEVRVYADDVLIGSAVAEGSEVVVTTDGTTLLDDGVHEITATQVIGDSEGDPSDVLEITVDTTAPAEISTTPSETATVGEAFEYDADSADEGTSGFEYSLSGAPDGMTIDAETGVVAWTPTTDQAVPQEFTIQFSDEAGNVTSQLVELTVLGDPPINADEYSVDEDTALVVDVDDGVLANDGDDQSGTLTAALVDGPSHGTLAFSADGSFTYTSNANFFGEDSFTYNADDGAGTGNVAKVTITVNGVDDPPEPVEDAYELDEDTTLAVDASEGVLANDVDVDGDELVAALGTGPTMGTVTLKEDGSFTYTPDANAYGEDSFTYIMHDGTTLLGPITVTLTINAVDDPPVAADDAYEVDEDGKLEVDADSGLLGNDTDVDSDDLTISVETGPNNGTLSVDDDGSFVYEPDPDFYGEDSFTYVLSDGTSTSEAATVIITVDAVADAPTATDDDATIAADGTAYEIDVLDNDYDVDDEDETLTITSVTQGSEGGNVEISDDGLTIEYTAPTDFTGTEAFEYTIEDEDGQTATATVTVTVTEPADGVLSGYVYIDINNDGVRDDGEVGVPGALVTLTGTTASDENVIRTALTDDDGSYSFTELAAGTYQLAETQPAALTDGTDSTENEDATVDDDVISDIVIGGNDELEENNFGEGRLLAPYSSIRWFFASTQSDDAFFRETIARGEEDAGNDDLATAIRDGETTFDAAVEEAQSFVADGSSADATTATATALSALAATAAATSSDDTAQIVSAPTSGVATVGSGGAVSYAPATVATGIDEFTYHTVDDTSSAIEVTVTVTTEGDDGSGSSATDSLVTALTVDPLYGTAELASDGSFVYLPADGVIGSDVFAYWLSDGTSSTNVTVSIVVKAADADEETSGDATDNAEEDESAEASDAAFDEALATADDWLVA